MSSDSLSTLFSDSSKNNFARLFKPVEFEKKNKVVPDPQANQKKKKKPKHIKDNKENIEKKSDVEGGSTLFDEKDKRTCFVGNISTSENKKSLTKLFKEFGEIESIRLRSVPVEGTAVDEDGNQNLVKKVCSNKQQFGDQKGSFNAYVVFKTPQSVSEAVLSANNRIFGSRHLRVDHCIPSVLDPKSTVFLGSIPFYADEEELRAHFAKDLAGGHDDIATVRIIRDPETLIGKGIAYISFNNHDAVLKALSLDQSKFRKRNIRVSTCGKRTKRRQQRLKPDSQPGTEAEAVAPFKMSQSDNRNMSNTRKRKRSKNDDDTPAARRIKIKKNLLKQKTTLGKNFNANKKKGKLGGVIKTAIKKAKAKIV